MVDGTNGCKPLSYSYCWIADASTCLKCSAEAMISTNNCSIDAILCALFDYTNWICLSCPTSAPILHQTGTYCIYSISNCLVYSSTNCNQCLPGYYADPLFKSCLPSYSIKLYAQKISSSYQVTNSPIKNVAVCLKNG